MSSAAPLDIRVVYPPPRGRARRAVPIPSTTAAPVARPTPARQTAVVRTGPSTAREWIVGFVCLLLSAGAYYGTWWKADPFIYMTLMWKTPLPGVDLNAVARTFPGADDAGGAPATRRPAVAVTESNAALKTAKLMGTTAYGWLTASTVSAFALALAGGAAWGAALRRRLRRVGVILAAGATLGLAFSVYMAHARYGLRYPPDALRAGMGYLGAYCLIIGFAVAGRARGLVRLASFSILLAAACTAAGLLLWRQAGALDGMMAATKFIAAVSLGHALVGVILWLTSSRLVR